MHTVIPFLPRVVLLAFLLAFLPAVAAYASKQYSFNGYYGYQSGGSIPSAQFVAACVLLPHIPCIPAAATAVGDASRAADTRSAIDKL